MAKLIKSDYLAYIKGGLVGTTTYTGSSTLYDLTNKKYIGDAANGLIFTKDGYIVGKGIEYYIGTAKPGELDSNSGITINNGVLSIIDSNGNTLTKTVTLPIFDADRGLTVVSNKVGHSNTAITEGTKGATATSSTSIVVPKITYDTYGHITAADQFTATLDTVTDAVMAVSKTMYLLGHAETGKTATALTKDTIKVVTDTNGNATLYAPALNISGGVSAITIGTSDPKTLDKYIENAVDDAKTLALTYKGTFTPSTTEASAAVPASSPVNGDTYKANGDGYIITTGTNTASIKTGDTVIAQVASDKTVTWTIIPSGDEKETFITIDSSSNQTWTNYTKLSGSLTLGNAALKIVGSVASGNTGLVTGGDVYTAITGHAGIDKVGTVTTIGLATDSGLEISDTSAGTYGTTAQTVTAYLRSKLKNYDKNTNDSALTGGRLYAIQLDKQGYLAVNIPQVYSLVVADANSDTVNDEKSATTLTLYFNLVDSTATTKVVDSYFGIAASTGLKIASKAGIATLTADVYSASASQTFAGNTTAPNYLIGSVTINGTTTTFYGHDTNTWRPIEIYKINTSTGLPLVSDGEGGWTDLSWNSDSNSYGDNKDTWRSSSVGTDYLTFSSTFSTNSDGEIDLVWAEVYSDGTIKYEI